MSQPETFLLDTHTLIFWHTGKHIANELILLLDQKARQGVVFVSAVSFWETALLVKKGKIALSDLHQWKADLVNYSHIKIAPPDATDMIDSVLLPDIHNDPFDRLLIVQTKRQGARLVTCDEIIQRYDVQTFWI